MRERRSKGNNKKDRIGRDKVLKKRDLLEIYHALRERFGFRDWWPGETKFEMFVGAILTQQTTWSNAERAIAKLKDANALDIDSVADIGIRKLESLIRSSGFYKQKARRLRNVCRIIRSEFGSLDKMFELTLSELREHLLSYNGIGNETADSIILYAAEKPTFVVDAYTKRIISRIDDKFNYSGYIDLKDYFESELKPDLVFYKDYHAQLVELGKRHCKTKPVCKGCPIMKMCNYGINSSTS